MEIQLINEELLAELRKQAQENDRKSLSSQPLYG